MRIVVVMKSVPDLVEEIELTSDEKDIEREFLKFVLNEWDDQALEEALLLKESDQAEVVAVGLADDPDIDQSLYTALAKGADSAVKLAGAAGFDTRSRVATIAAWLRDHPADLVLSGVQSPDDLDGQLPSALGAALGLPHVSVVASVVVDGDKLKVRQEFSGGRAAELAVSRPAVIGLQASRQPPRYAPISKIRQVMQAGGLEEVAVSAEAATSGLEVRRMYPPEQTTHAEMLAGDANSVADQIVELLRARGLVKG
jgi:electron transfer flavoprotein beta subunit